MTEKEEESYLFEIRKKETKINKFNKVQLEKNKEKWKKINIITPLLFVLILFLITHFTRKIKYPS